MKTWLIWIALAAPAWLWVSPMLAQHACCPQCSQNGCRKVCRLVCETKQETKFCFSAKCEDFCLPGRSCIVGEKCVTDPCTCRTHREYCWQPSCGPVRQRMVLVKTPVTIEKTVYRCVVEVLCPNCDCAKIDAVETQRLAQKYPALNPEIIPTSAEMTVEEFEHLASRPGAVVNDSGEAQADERPVASSSSSVSLFQRLFTRR